MSINRSDLLAGIRIIGANLGWPARKADAFVAKVDTRSSECWPWLASRLMERRKS